MYSVKSARLEVNWRREKLRFFATGKGDGRDGGMKYGGKERRGEFVRSAREN